MKKEAPEKPILFVGSSHPELGRRLSEEMDILQGKMEIERFADEEIYINLKEDVAGRHVFVLQSGHEPSSEYILELCFMLRAIRDHNPASLTAVLPFTPYRRQERKAKPGEPVSAEFVIQMIELAGTTHAITIDLHSTTNETFFEIPLTHLHSWDLLADAIRTEIEDISNLTVVGPDEGSRRRASSIAHRLDVPMAIMRKQRPKHDKVVITDFAGEVDGRDLLIVDDEVCTAGTIAAATERLKKMGAKKIYFAITHPILTHPGSERLHHSHLDIVYVTDTIPIVGEKIIPKLHILSVAPMLAKAITEHTNTLNAAAGKGSI